MIILFLEQLFIRNLILILFVYAYIYPLENIIGGLIVYIYQKNSVRKNEEIEFFGLDLIYNKKKLLLMGNVKKYF